MNKKLSDVFMSPRVYGLLYLISIPVFAAVYSGYFGIKCVFESGPINFLEAIYFSAITITTLGFGDIHPKSGEGITQLIVAFEAVLGVSLIGLFLNSVAGNSYRLRRRAIDGRVKDLIHSIMLHQLFVIQTGSLKEISQRRIRIEDLSENEIRENLVGTFYKSPVPSSINIVGESIFRHLQAINDNTEDLLSYTEYLDPELIEIVSGLNNRQTLERWSREYQAEPTVTPYGTIDPHSSDISFYAKDFHIIHKTRRKLGAYWERRFASHPLVIDSMLLDAVVHLNEPKRGLKLAKMLYDHSKYARNAYFFTIEACLQTGDKKKARWALDEYMATGPEDAEYVRSQIENRDTHVSKEQLNDFFNSL